MNMRVVVTTFGVVMGLVFLASCGGDKSDGPSDVFIDVTPDVPIDIPPPEPDIAEDTTPPCVPGTMFCFDDTTLALCTVTEPLIEACPEDHRCLDGMCRSIVCTPNIPIKKCATTTEFIACDKTGTQLIDVPCDTGLTCLKGDCVGYKCLPGSYSCMGFGAVRRCLDDGSDWEIVETCEKAGVCKDAKCIEACDVDIKAATYVGCNYYAVDLDNIEGGQFETLGLVVSVPNSSEDANVTITNSASGVTFTAEELGVTDLLVPSGTLKVFTLPGGMDLDGSMKSDQSFHVQTTSPSIIHQFNPLNGEGVYTNDASLLLPTHSMGTEYVVLSWPMRKDPWAEGETLRGFVTIVAVTEGLTEFSILPRSDVLAGGQDSGVWSISANTPTTFVLQEGEVLNLETEGEQGADLTGSLIHSDAPLAVFGGHECANVPLGVNACDHLEQQLTPIDAWGHIYIADPFKARSPSQFDIWRVVGGAPDVTVKTVPPQPGYEEFILHEGTYVTFKSSQAFSIKATGPIMVGHYMTGSSYPGHIKTCDEGKTGIGDPALTLGVPLQQYLSRYTVLTPPGYQKNFINIIAPLSSKIEVDGQPVTQPLLTVAPGLDWGIVQLAVPEGVHEVSGTKKFGLTAYGYACDVSYAYPGGMRLQALGTVGGAL